MLAVPRRLDIDWFACELHNVPIPCTVLSQLLMIVVVCAPVTTPYHQKTHCSAGRPDRYTATVLEEYTTTSTLNCAILGSPLSHALSPNARVAYDDHLVLSSCDFLFQVDTSPGEVIKPDSWRCIDNEGMPIENFPLDKGNLYVQFTVKFPESLQPSQITALKKASSFILPSGRPRLRSQNLFAFLMS